MNGARSALSLWRLTATILVFLPCSISVPKMHFTETVDLLEACVFGAFESPGVGELTKFMKQARNVPCEVGGFSVNGVLRVGVQG